MPKVIMCKGLPGSGKSTWAKEQARRNPDTIRVNKDDLRSMLLDYQHNTGQKFKPKREKQAIGARDALVRQAMVHGYNVIVDDTNFHPSHEARLRQLVHDHNQAALSTLQYTFEVKYFEVDVETAISRDLRRPDSVGRDVIEAMWSQWLCDPPPACDPDLTDIVLCDFDGTLADLNGRDPYDPATVADDLLIEPTARLISAMYKAEKVGTIILSGRKEKYREESEAWLDKHNVPYVALYMRPAIPDGENAPKDSVIKRQLYEDHILGKFNVVCVFDDRDQVVRLWRSLGLRCFQAALGGF